jgi:uncharacterized protein YprB with RNaseH-like and TPR domain
MASPEKSTVLSELRSKIQAIFERTQTRTSVPHLEPIDLPFATLPGPLHVRTLLLGPAHRIGHVSTHAARAADASCLSLLALDARVASARIEHALFLDTETTGLSGGAGTVAFLVGLAFFSPQGLVLEQLLVRRLGEEAPMLARVAERLSACELIVTYNGKAFDLPLLRTRFVMNRMPPPPDRPHLDLLHVARRVHRARKFAKNLTALERNVLGFERAGDVPSSEISAIYLHFLRSGDPRALLGVVEHNAFDVASMAALVGLYGEPFDRLRGDDLAGVARTLHRQKHDRALEIAHLAVEKGGGPASVRARADIAKARGERDLALEDYSKLEDDPDEGAGARLELAKLFEHHKKNARAALAVLGKGIREGEKALRKRRARLEQKIAKDPIFQAKKA